MRDSNMEQSIADPCVFIEKKRPKGVPQNARPLVIWVHVDDIRSFCDYEEQMVNFLLRINKYIQLDAVNPKNVLGCKVTNNNGAVEFSMQKYVDKIAERYGADHKSRKARIPIDVKYNNIRDRDNRLLVGTERREYQSVAASLLHASTTARPDIAFATLMACRRMHAPTAGDMSIAQQVLNYLAATKEIGLQYGISEHDRNSRRLTAASDADFGNQPDSRTVTGYVFFFGGAAVHWGSHVERTVASDSTDAEILAQVSACKDAIWIRLLLKELGMPQNGPTPIDNDNQAAVAVAEQDAGEANRRTRHSAVRRAFVRQQVNDGIVAFKDVRSADMPADVFTKALPFPAFARHRASLLGSR